MYESQRSKPTGCLKSFVTDLLSAIRRIYFRSHNKVILVGSMFSPVLSY